MYYCKQNLLSKRVAIFCLYQTNSEDNLFLSLFHISLFRLKYGAKIIVNVNFTSLVYFKPLHLHICRNPYDRLLSAYKDKVIANNGSQIRASKNFCSIGFNKVPEPALTFAQFTHCIIEQTNRTFSNSKRPKNQGYGGGLDFHWRPQTLLCNFCESDYNIIGHIEHMDEDLVEALKRLNMTKSPVRENASGNSSINKLSLSHWYKQLSTELLRNIHLLYSHDFELLGFSTNFSKTDNTHNM